MRCVKIIEAMKELVRLNEKRADLRAKVGQYCAAPDFETPTYPSRGFRELGMRFTATDSKSRHRSP